MPILRRKTPPAPSDEPPSEEPPPDLPGVLGQASNLVLLGALAAIIAAAVEYAHWASAIDAFLVLCFAAAICLVVSNAYQYSQFSIDRLGRLLAMLLAVSATIMIVILMISIFYFLPESPLFVEALVEDCVEDIVRWWNQQ